MNSNQMFRHLARTFQRLLSLSASKGLEYCGGQEIDRLRNFKDGGARVGVHPVKHLFIALDKHWNSISTYVRELDQPVKRVLSEPIAGRIDDAILYLNLMKMLLVDLGIEKDPNPEGEHPSQDYSRLPEMFDALFWPRQFKEALPVPDISATTQHTGRWETGPGAPQYVTVCRLPPKVAQDVPHVVPGKGSHDPIPEGTGKAEKDASSGCVDTDSIRALTKLVTDWSVPTFPRRSLDVIILKLTSHELPELVVALANRDWKKVDGEVGDVLILLLDLFAIRQAQLGATVVEKMEVNRLRKWVIDGYGVSRHVVDKEANHG
jgi:NTP pyrophosphatase (non-canonical NTP hydrolase)